MGPTKTVNRDVALIGDDISVANMKIQDMLLVSKVEVLVDNIELNCWKKRKEKGRLRS